MDVQRVSLGDRKLIQIDSIRGTLRLRKGQAGQLEARVAQGVEVSFTVDEREDAQRVSCEGDCQLMVPPDVRVEATTVGGDVSAIDLPAELMIRTVGGSLRLRRTGSTTAERIGGELSAHRLKGDLMVDSVGGDALVDRADGDVRLRKIGADVRLSRIRGTIDVSAGGDGTASLEPSGETSSAIAVGGDLHCYLPEAASVRLLMSAGGSCRVALPDAVEQTSEGSRQVQLGAGEAEVSLTAGGDVVLGAGDDEFAFGDLGEAIAMRVGAELESQLAELETRLSGLGDRLQGFESERIARKIRSSFAKAQRRAADAQRRALRMRSFRVEAAPHSSSGSASDEERLAVLRMVERGKISVDEAESLLEALGT